MHEKQWPLLHVTWSVGIVVFVCLVRQIIVFNRHCVDCLKITLMMVGKGKGKGKGSCRYCSSILWNWESSC